MPPLRRSDRGFSARAVRADADGRTRGFRDRLSGNHEQGEMAMKIADVMTTNVVSVTASTPLKEVARLLVESGFSGFPVIDDDGTLLGVVSGSDVLVKEGGHGPRLPSIAALLGL